MPYLLSLILFAWSASFLLSFSTSSLGCFVLWRRMSYFGDTLAHSTMLGFSLSIVMQTNYYVGLVAVVFFLTFVLYIIERRTKVLHMDSILGIVAHISLALGIIIISILAKTVRVDVLEYLFGDLTAVTTNNLIVIALMDVVILGIIYYFWKPFVAVLINEDIAFVEGVNVQLIKSLLVFMLAIIVATCITMIGALLITSLLVIPASTARSFAKSPQQMIVYSFIVSNIAFVIGIVGSVYWDLPTSPAIVATLGIMFLVSLIFKPKQA